MSKKIYIAGPMTGLPDNNYPAFHAAAKRLRSQGFDVLNPAENQACESWLDYMRLSLRQIADADAMMMLPGWSISKGAMLEHHIAMSLGIDVWLNAAPAQAVTESMCEHVTDWSMA